MKEKEQKRHWTLVVQLKEVIPPDVIRNSSGYPEKGPMGATMMSERQVIDRLSFSVAADDEVEAFSKAMNILEVSRPAVPDAAPQG